MSSFCYNFALNITDYIYMMRVNPHLTPLFNI